MFRRSSTHSALHQDPDPRLSTFSSIQDPHPQDHFMKNAISEESVYVSYVCRYVRWKINVFSHHHIWSTLYGPKFIYLDGSDLFIDSKALVYSTWSTVFNFLPRSIRGSSQQGTLIWSVVWWKNIHYISCYNISSGLCYKLGWVTEKNAKLYGRWICYIISSVREPPGLGLGRGQREDTILLTP